MQESGGDHKPTPERAGGVTRPGHSDHAALRQRHRHQSVGHRPHHRPPSPGPFPAGTGEFHRDRQVGRADAEQQVVRVGATSLPQAAARARGDAERGGGVGALLAPGGLFRVERGPGVALDPRPAIGVVGRRLARPSARGRRARSGRRRSAAPGSARPASAGTHGAARTPASARSPAADPPPAPAAGADRPRPARPPSPTQPVPTAAPTAAQPPTAPTTTPQRQRPRRPAEIQPGPVRRRTQRRVRWRIRRQPEQRPADGDLLPRPPRHRRPELRPVQRGGGARIRGDLTAALVVDVDQQRPRGHGRVADPDRRRRAAADVRPPGADPVDHPGVGPAGHQNVDQAGRLGDDAAVGAAEADHAAVSDRRLGQRQPPPDPLAVDVKRTTGRRVRAPPRRRPPRAAGPAPPPPRANRSSSAATAAIGVAASASSTMSVDCRVAGETTVTNSRINHPEAWVTASDRPATLLHGREGRPVQLIRYRFITSCAARSRGGPRLRWQAIDWRLPLF